MTPGKRERREIYYQGHVQGVGFRYTARHLASRFPVTGYVQNLPDGRVFLVAEGDSESLDAFLGAVRAAMVWFIRATDEKTLPATGEFEHFSIRF